MLELPCSGMVPGNVRSETTHRHRAGKGSVNQQGTALAEQVDEAPQAVIGDVRQPRSAKLGDGIGGGHETLRTANTGSMDGKSNEERSESTRPQFVMRN